MLKNYLSYDDEELMNEIRAGNMLAFDCLYRRYSNKVYQFGRHILKSNEDTENLVQDVFLSLYENRHKIEKCSSVKYYIYTITYNSAISQIRKRVNESRFIDYLKYIQDCDQTFPNSQLEYRELVEELTEIVSTLPKRQREIYLLHREKGFKYKEIARKMNISINTVENQMSGAINKIRQKVRNYNSMCLLFAFFLL